MKNPVIVGLCIFAFILLLGAIILSGGIYTTAGTSTGFFLVNRFTGEIQCGEYLWANSKAFQEYTRWAEGLPARGDYKLAGIEPPRDYYAEEVLGEKPKD